MRTVEDVGPARRWAVCRLYRYMEAWEAPWMETINFKRILFKPFRHEEIVSALHKDERGERAWHEAQVASAELAYWLPAPFAYESRTSHTYVSSIIVMVVGLLSARRHPHCDCSIAKFKDRVTFALHHRLVGFILRIMLNLWEKFGAVIVPCLLFTFGFLSRGIERYQLDSRVQVEKLINQL